MAERTCHNCVYCCCDPCLWLRLLWGGLPLLPRCANHPQWPGQLHDVPGVPCRNYRPRPALPPGAVRMIALGDGCYAYVDAADYEWLKQWHWYLDNGYAARHEKGKIILMHRQIMQPPQGMVVDHIDGSKANNCRINLRVCTRAQNMRNKRKHSGSSSRFKCVFYDKRTGKWYARCRYQGKNRVLGYFDDEVEAARAYDRQAVELFGAFARPNFPEEWPPERRAQVYAQRQEPEDEGKKRKVKGKDAAAHAQTRGRRDRKRTTKSARARAPKREKKGKTENRNAEGRGAPPQ
ncbi:MAG: HNH endonuclease [Phycisphaerae bacterium]|nr:HNH endonuclease [Phycisphaerae bacterium]